MSTSLDAILLLVSWTYVSLAPYTKVEESFNLHATHDVLMYGVRPENLHKKYDHFVFPGAVPRTFVGSVLLAWISQLFLRGALLLGHVTDKVDIQVLVRLALASVNALGLSLLRRAVSRRFGGPTSVLFTVLTCTQFHLLFWMGRTLPNMFALLPANVALYFLIDRAPNATRPSQQNLHRAIGTLTFATVVFRSELVLLLGPLVLQAIVRRYTSVAKILKVGIVAGTLSAALTVLVDSYFWQTWLWPELQGVYFNAIEGKSAEWGVSPFHAYLTSHLPKLLLSAAPLSVLGAILDQRIRGLLVPYIAFVLLISGLGHKEWRFVIYTVPAFNIAAARGANWLISRKKSTLFGRLSFLSVVGMLGANALATFLLVRSSCANYPGGASLYAFNQLLASEQNVHVHISNLAAQTGASLFLHSHAPPFLPGLAPPSAFGRPTNWVYNKTEDLSLDALTAAPHFTHLIAEAPALTPTAMEHWSAVAVVDGFDGWAFNVGDVRAAFDAGVGEGLKALGSLLEMRRAEKLVILKRKV